MSLKYHTVARISHCTARSGPSARHVPAALGAMAVMTDRNDARRCPADAAWAGFGRCTSMGAQETRAVLTPRKLVQSKLQDVENSLRGILRCFGLNVGKTTHWSLVGGSGTWWPVLRAWKRSPRHCCRCERCCCASSTASRSGCGPWRARFVFHRSDPTVRARRL
jgi:hypothetical protein